MSKLFSLSNWMKLRPNHSIAIRDGIDISTEDFVLNIHQWQQALANHNGHRWVVYHSDPYEFLSILFALWYLQRVACMPGDNRPATIARLLQQADGCVGELEGAISRKVNTIDTDMADLNLPELNVGRVAVELYTSGSSGEPTAIVKSIAQFESELLTLQEQFPAVPGTTILSTVSHQHLYGLTFRLLRPFSSGQPILCELCEYTEDIFNRGQRFSQFILVSSPSHISRVNELLPWSSMHATCLNIFSAAAPLEKSDALRMSKLLNAPLWEIYGSSETGVIAWRQQTESKGDARWQLLPHVTFDIDNQGKVRVCSDFADQSSPFLSDTLDVFPDGCFVLKGRSDKIVKIEGKRVSLNAIEQLLLQHEWVSKAQALVVSRKRTEVAIVLVLSALGVWQLMTKKRSSLIRTLRELLLSNFETIVVPRRWRFVDTMPYNQQGKITLSSLQDIMEQPALLKWPIINGVIGDTLYRKISCTIPGNLVYLDGHFEQTPILPGVAQVHWAQKYACEYFDIAGRFSHLEVIKFSNIIQPNENVDIGTVSCN